MYTCKQCGDKLYQSWNDAMWYYCDNRRCNIGRSNTLFAVWDLDADNGGREVKEVRVIPLFDGEMYEMWFPLGMQRRGYFKESIQPMIDIIKAKVPITAREYNPDSKHWTISKEYYVPIAEVMKAMGFKVTVQEVAKQNAPNVDVPKDYEENFYRSEAKPSAGTESYTSVREQLFTLLEVALESQEPADLKSIYRKKARQLHPDLGGDAEKMSELNRLWSLYNAS